MFYVSCLALYPFINIFFTLFIRFDTCQVIISLLPSIHASINILYSTILGQEFVNDSPRRGGASKECHHT